MYLGFDIYICSLEQFGPTSALLALENMASLAHDLEWRLYYRAPFPSV